MPIFKADAAKCRKDGICSKLCPMSIIKDDDHGFPEAVESRMPTCIGCGHCVAFCPHGASCLEDIPGTNGSALQADEAATPRIDRSLMPEPEKISALVRSRRSTRSFSDKPVSKETLAQILRDCDWAPTAKNARNQRWVIINSPEKIHQLGDLLATAADHVGNHPANPNGDIYKLLSMSWRRGFDPFMRGAKQLAVMVAENSPFAMSDCAIALTYFEMVAYANGIGCCWAGYFTSLAQAYRPVCDFLGVKADEIVGGGQMFGYPGIRASSIPVRSRLPIGFIE